MTTSFSRVETLSPDNRNLLKLPYLSDQLLPPGKLDGFLLLLSVEGILDLLVDSVSEVAVLIFQSLYSSTCVCALLSYFIVDHVLLCDLFFDVLSSFFHSLVGLDLHGLGIELVGVSLFLLSFDGLVSREVHGYLASLDVVKSQHLVSLVHLRLPLLKFTLIPLVPLEIL